jgi:hypothetical protein
MQHERMVRERSRRVSPARSRVAGAPSVTTGTCDAATSRMVAKETAEDSPTDTAFFPDEGDEVAGDAASQALVNAGEPDVLLEAPEVNVERISIETEQLRTGVSLFARIGNFVALEVGANAQLGNVSLKMRGVRAQGKVKVHLQKVYAIILRTLASIDRRPELAGGERPMPELGTAVGRATTEPARDAEKATAPVDDQLGAIETIPGAIGTASQVSATQVKNVAQAVEKTAEKAKQAMPSVEKTAATVKHAVPPADQVAKKAERATGKIAEAATGDGKHDTTERVLRPIKHAAHEVADKVRLAITMAKVAATTHRAARLPRRAAKASGHVTERVLHPDVPGLKRK